MRGKMIGKILFLFLVSVFVGAEPLYSPTWGFRIDLPEGYEFSDGDGKNNFSFTSQFGTSLDLVVYTDKGSAEELAADVEKKISSQGEKNTFDYHGSKAVLSSLSFPDPQKRPGASGSAGARQGANARLGGWALYIEMNPPESAATKQIKGKPILCAMSYGPVDNALQSLHLSLLDSISAGEADRYLPGPVSEFSYPPGEWKLYPVAGTGKQAWFREDDAEAAQALVDREFSVLKRYTGSSKWQEAWKRFYRAIYRDSFDRLKDAAFILERAWAVEDFLENPSKGVSALPGTAAPEKSAGTGGSITPTTKLEAESPLGSRSDEARSFAQKTLSWVQNFKYERNLIGSDFVNLVSAAQEGRGDCDSRAMLWAIILEQADIPAAIMVSREFGHAMGLADLEGAGARFPFKEGDTSYRWLVAETTAAVDIGMIGENVSEITTWLGIVF
jgi:hypothetical protein